MLTYQAANGTLERTIRDPHILSYHGFGIALRHEDRGLVLRVAQHAKLQHLTGRDFAQTTVARMTEDTDRHWTIRQCLYQLLLALLLLNEKKVVNGRNQNHFRLLVGFFRLLFTKQFHLLSIGHGNEMDPSFLLKVTAHFLLQTIEGAHGIPGPGIE